MDSARLPRKGRRVPHAILYTPPQLAAMMEMAGVTTLEALIDADCAPELRKPIPQAQSLPPRDQWRSRGE